MQQAKPQTVLSSLADYIEKNNDKITDKFIRKVNQDTEIKSSGNLTHAQLLNHLPQLLQELCNSLRQTDQSAVKEKTKYLAEVHGQHRCQQGYNLGELLCELAILRNLITIEYVTTFVRQNPDCTLEIEMEARSFINMFFGSTFSASIQQFVKEHEAEVQQYQIQLEKSNKELIEANERLKYLDQSRLRFTRTISHELGNFLNSIMLAIPLLKNDNDELTRDFMINILKRNTVDMKILLEQLNDYSVLLAGKEAICLETFNMPQLLMELIKVIMPLAGEKGLKIELDLHPGLKDVTCDRLKVSEIVNNLVGNAIKYTSCGKICLKTDIPDIDHFSIVVEDTGEGISKENITRIFEEFQRVSIRKDIRGTGLGLAITKRLVELLQGNINVISELGKGSRFEVVLPQEINVL